LRRGSYIGRALLTEDRGREETGVPVRSSIPKKNIGIEKNRAKKKSPQLDERKEKAQKEKNQPLPAGSTATASRRVLQETTPENPEKPRAHGVKREEGKRVPPALPPDA